MIFHICLPESRDPSDKEFPQSGVICPCLQLGCGWLGLTLGQACWHWCSMTQGGDTTFTFAVLKGVLIKMKIQLHFLLFLHAWMAQVKSFLELKTWTFLSYILKNMVADDLVTVRHHKNVRWNLFINNIINYAMLRNMYDQWIMSSSRWVMALTSSLVVRLEFPLHIFLRFLPWIVCKVFQSLTNINMKSYYTFIVIL